MRQLYQSNSETDKVQLTEEIIYVLAVNVDKSRHGEPRVIKAKQEELESLKKYETYEEVTDSDILLEHIETK